MNKDDTFVTNIARQLWNGSAVVFVGAGFSRNADPSYPLWNGLADQMWEQLHPDKDKDDKAYVDVLGLAEEYQAAYDRPQLDALLLSACHKSNVTNLTVHQELLSLPWVDVLTTNYDTLLEQATNHVRNIRYSVVLNKNDLSIAQRPRIIKLHGSFPSERPFVITARDYRRYPYDHASFVNTVRQSILENTLVLVGFSGDDPNFLNWLEWVNIQQGDGGARKIYVLGVSNITDSKEKLLAERGIEYHNIVEYYETAGDCKEAFSRFFTEMNDRNNRVDDWPRFEKDDPFHADPINGDKGEIEKRCGLLERLKLTYPGWIVPPKDVMENLFFRLSLDNPLLPAIGSDVPIEAKVQYYSLLVWCYEITLTSWPERLIVAVEKFLSEVEAKTTERDNRYIEIEIGLMRARRERGDIDVRNDVFRMARDFGGYATLEQKAKLWYEICLRCITIHDYKRLVKHVDEFDLSPLPAIWRVRKAGLYLQINRLDEAKELLSNTISSMRDSHLSGDGGLDCNLLSTESAALTLLYRINDAIRSTKRRSTSERIDQDSETNGLDLLDDVGDAYLMQLLKPPVDTRDCSAKRNSEDEFVRKERRRFFDRQYELKRYKCDMLEVMGDIASAIGCGGVSESDSQVPFDITEISDIHGQRWDLFEQWRASAFMRINPALGWPLRIGDWVYVKGEQISYACSKNFGQYGLALFTLLSYGSSREIDVVVSRWFISRLNPVYRELFAENVIKHILRELDEYKYDFRPGIWTFLAKFIAILRLSNIRLAAQIVKKLYESASRLHLGHYDDFILRYARSIRESELCSVIRILTSVRYDRNARAPVLGRLPEMLPILAENAFAGWAGSMINKDDFQYWISSCRNGGYISFRCLLNILAAGVMGLLTEEQIKFAIEMINDVYPSLRSIPTRIPGAINLLFRHPWAETLNPSEAAKKLVLNHNAVNLIDGERLSYQRIYSLRRKIDFINAALAQKRLMLAKKEALDGINNWGAILHGIIHSSDIEHDCLNKRLVKQNIVPSISMMLAMLIESGSLVRRDIKRMDAVCFAADDDYFLPIEVALAKTSDVRKLGNLQKKAMALLDDVSQGKRWEGLTALLLMTFKSGYDSEKIIARINMRLSSNLPCKILHRYIAFAVAVCRNKEFECKKLGDTIDLILDAASHYVKRKIESNIEYSESLLIANDLNELSSILKKRRSNVEKGVLEKIDGLTKGFSEIFADVRSY